MPAFRPGLPTRRRRLKTYALITFIVLACYFFLYHPSSLPVGLDTLDKGQLSIFMNKLSNSKNHEIASSFDWLTSPKRYDVEAPIPLPASKPTKLPRVQHDFPPETVEEATRREGRRIAVRNSFKKTWNSYRKAAWMKDEYHPLSNTGRNNWGGWSAMLVDSLDTLWIMGLRDEFQEAVEAVATIDFGNCTEVDISVFETTIRYLGGLIGAYDLSGEEVLLNQAIQVGEMLMHAFDTPNGMPVDRLNIKDSKEGTGFLADPHICIAGIGSLTMEFVRLAQITNNSKYYHFVAQITDAFVEALPSTLIPGLFSTFMDPRHLNWNDSRATTFSVGAMADSTFEYFAKTHALLAGADPAYRTLYLESAAQIEKHLLFRPMLPSSPDVLFAGDVRLHDRRDPTSGVLTPEMQHLSCFAGGMFALGGKLFNEPHHVRVGERLTRGCMLAYAATPTGIMPEIFEAVPCVDKTECVWNETVWVAAVLKHFGPKYTGLPEKAISDQRLPPGFASIRDTRYVLRPEAIESVFVLYRITGASEWREGAWAMFSAVESATRVEAEGGGRKWGSYAALKDVTVIEGERADIMETFWTAETLKYFYLCFSPTDLVGLDEWVLNTEAHPFRRPI